MLGTCSYQLNYMLPVVFKNKNDQNSVYCFVYLAIVLTWFLTLFPSSASYPDLPSSALLLFTGARPIDETQSDRRAQAGGGGGGAAHSPSPKGRRQRTL